MIFRSLARAGAMSLGVLVLLGVGGCVTVKDTADQVVSSNTCEQTFDKDGRLGGSPAFDACAAKIIEVLRGQLVKLGVNDVYYDYFNIGLTAANTIATAFGSNVETLKGLLLASAPKVSTDIWGASRSESHLGIYAEGIIGAVCVRDTVNNLKALGFAAKTVAVDSQAADIQGITEISLEDIDVSSNLAQAALFGEGSRVTASVQAEKAAFIWFLEHDLSAAGLERSGMAQLQKLWSAILISLADDKRSDIVTRIRQQAVTSLLTKLMQFRRTFKGLTERATGISAFITEVSVAAQDGRRIIDWIDAATPQFEGCVDPAVVTALKGT